MKKPFSIALVVLGWYAHAQTALYNEGNIQIHAQGQLGFHTNLINNAPWDQNEGLVGFYGDRPLSVAGAFAPTFKDVELANDQGVLLTVPVAVAGNFNFVVGNVYTYLDTSAAYLHFLQNSFYVGETDNSKVSGYAAVSGEQNFSFPVGDASQLRPLILNSDAVNTLAKCAYYRDNPGNNTFGISMDPNAKVRDLGSVITTEYWRLETGTSGTVTLSWNTASQMANFVGDVSEITLVGFSKTAQQWVNLGVDAVSGDLNQGFATSNTFIPDDYEAITFGGLDVPEDILTLDNYFLSPDGDGINDALVIDGMELSPHNQLAIYNRQGLKVFELENYTNEFRGFSNLNNFVLNRNVGLPEGLYFYTADLKDLNLKYQGYFFLNR